MKNLDWLEILDRLAQFATSQVARDQLKNLVPLESEFHALQNFAEIEEARSILQTGRRPFMESLDLYPIWNQRLQKEATLKTLELRDIRHFCHEALALKEVIKPFSSSWILELSDQLLDASEPLSAIDQLMTPEGEIRNDASETLYRLFHEKSGLVKQTQNILDRLIRQHELEPVLQDRYVTTREGRWVLPIRSGKQNQFEGITHASSQSKATVFMEPKEIIPLNNRLRQIELDLEEEIERLLRELSHYLMGLLPEFAIAYKKLLAADIRLAQAQLALQLNAQPVRFDSASVDLVGLRHPLLILGQTDEVVSNHVKLDHTRRILLLSGPNAGGKTVLLKAVGLAAQMARCGLMIATDKPSSLPFFKNIFVAVGDSQSVDEHLSTFAAHLMILNRATQAVGKDQLLLIDEICGSTDPEEGTALARAFISTYATNQNFGVITSHLGPLKLGWDEKSGVVNGSLEYDNRSGKPTYNFLLGVPGQSLAIQTARRVGVSETIIRQALENLSPEMKRYLTGLEEIDLMRKELQGIRDQLRMEKALAEKEQLRYSSMIQKFESERDQLLDKEVRQAEKKIESMLEQIKVEDVFRRHERIEQMKMEMPEIIKASASTSTPTSQLKIETADEFTKAFPPGSKVFVTTLGRDAVVQGTPTAKGEVAILSNSMRLMVNWALLKPPQYASNPTAELVRRAGEIASPLDQDRSIDIRGQPLETALKKLEGQLDIATLNDESRVRIVHGHGTETLKRGIRQFLSRSPYVKLWKAGTPESGGDGVTWVELN